jgi:TonB family protein
MKNHTQSVRLFLSLVGILVLSLSATPQSGRRAPVVRSPAPVPTPETTETPTRPAKEEPPPVTAEKNQDYRCSEDGSLERILEKDDFGEVVISPKEADTRATLTSKPKPTYTKEARRNGIQGFVTLKVLLSSRGKVGRVRIVKGLPAGLTENAIRAACKIEFKPAMKNGQAVAQWVTAEYVFRLADSSIFTP